MSIVAGILHFHNYKYSNVEVLESGSDKLFSHFQLVGANNYECIIQHNLINLQTSLLFQFNDYSFVTVQNISYYNFKYLFRI